MYNPHVHSYHHHPYHSHDRSTAGGFHTDRKKKHQNSSKKELSSSQTKGDAANDSQANPLTVILSKKTQPWILDFIKNPFDCRLKDRLIKQHTQSRSYDLRKITVHDSCDKKDKDMLPSLGNAHKKGTNLDYLRVLREANTIQDNLRVV